MWGCTAHDVFSVGSVAKLLSGVKLRRRLSNPYCAFTYRLCSLGWDQDVGPLARYIGLHLSRHHHRLQSLASAAPLLQD